MLQKDLTIECLEARAWSLESLERLIEEMCFKMLQDPSLDHRAPAVIAPEHQNQRSVSGSWSRATRDVARVGTSVKARLRKIGGNIGGGMPGQCVILLCGFMRQRLAFPV